MFKNTKFQSHMLEIKFKQEQDLENVIFKYSNTYYNANFQLQISRMKTPCAFHQGHFIIQFCKSSCCLLPLCQQCVIIHKQEHSTGISQPMQLMNIQLVVKQINHSINHQFKYIDTIVTETINKFRQSDQHHKKLMQQILHHRQVMLMSLSSTFDSIFLQLENNAKRREIWLRHFNQSIFEVKQQLNSMINSLMGQKYLRTVIMWNRMKPYESIEQISKKSEKKWVVPSFAPCNQEKFVNFVQNNINLKIVQIQGDSGVKKILDIIRILRYGQQSHQQLPSPNLIVSNKNFHVPPVTQQKSPIPMGVMSLPIVIPTHQHTKQNLSTISSNGSYIVANNQHLSPTQNPLSLNSPTRKTSHKKLEVLSSLEHHKSAIQINQNK